MYSPYLENYILLNRVEMNRINKLNKNQVFEWNVINLVFKKYQKDILKRNILLSNLIFNISYYILHIDIKPENLLVNVNLFA